MAFFIHPDQCLLFFRDPEAAFTAARMKQVLSDDGVTAEGNVEPFALQWADGPTLYASIIRGDIAAIPAARQMGREHKYSALAAATDAYIEIKFESLDEVLDEINTLVEV